MQFLLGEELSLLDGGSVLLLIAGILLAVLGSTHSSKSWCARACLFPFLWPAPFPFGPFPPAHTSKGWYAGTLLVPFPLEMEHRNEMDSVFHFKGESAHLRTTPPIDQPAPWPVLVSWVVRRKGTGRPKKRNPARATSS